MNALKTFVLIVLSLSTFTLKAQWSTNGSKIYYNDNNVGVGIADPFYRLEAITRNERIPTIVVSGINMSYLSDLIYVNDNIHFEIGLTTSPNPELGILAEEGSDNDRIAIGGLNAFYDRYLLGMGLVSNKRMVANYGYNYKDRNYKYFRVLAPETNDVDFSLEFKNVDREYVAEDRLWFNNNGDIIVAKQKSLSLGSASDEALKIYAGASKEGYNPDISILHSSVGIETNDPTSGSALDINGITYARSQVGILTMPTTSAALEVNGTTYARSNVGIKTTPNPNAALDVNGIVFVSNKISINETDPIKIGTHSLAVNGTAIFTKAFVKLNNGSPGWPDYVFTDSYKLRSLKDLEAYIEENNHLPEIPSANDIQKNGIDLGENQSLLLKKIEELSLYVIAQNKQQQQLSNQLEQQQKLIDSQSLMLKEQQKMLLQLKEEIKK